MRILSEDAYPEQGCCYYCRRHALQLFSRHLARRARLVEMQTSQAAARPNVLRVPLVLHVGDSGDLFFS